MSSLLIFVAQLYSFSLLAMLLHYASPRIGLAPLLFLLAAIIGLLNGISLDTIIVKLTDDLVLHPAVIFIPLALLIILLLYVVHGTRPAQIAIVTIVGVNIVVFLTLVFLSLYIVIPTDSPGMFADNSSFNLLFVRGMLVSTVTFACDTVVMLVVYQAINNNLKWIPALLIPGIAFTAGLWTDSFVYNFGAFVGTERFAFPVPFDVIIKSFAGAVLTPLIGWYLTRLAPKMAEYVGPEHRRTLSIVYRSIGNDARVESLENELRISRSIYNQLTQNIEEIFWLIDIEARRFIYVSPAYERITKYSTDPLYDDINHLLTIIDEEDRDDARGDIVRFLTEERDVEFRIRCPDDTVRWLRAQAFPIKDGAGNIIRFAGIAEDITERKHLDDQRVELALAHQRMQILHDFLRDASHDLKSPLASMMLKVDMLRHAEGERREKLQDELIDRVQNLSDLIDDLFTLSLFEGGTNANQDTVDLWELARDVINEQDALAEAKSLQLILNTSPGDCSVTGSREALQRLLNNLIGNAIRYTAEGRVTVTFTPGEDSISFSVRDTGIGVPQDELEQIFDRFYRSKNAKSYFRGGTGLGLAISRAIVENHKGQISADSDLDHGATFTVRLPRRAI